MRICCYIGALATLIVVPALPDIMDVGFTPGPGGSGSVLVRCDTCPFGAGISNSFSTSSSTPNSFTGIVSFTDPGTGRSATVTDNVEQDDASNAMGFSADVMEDITISGIGVEWAAEGTAFDNFTVDFTVTAQSLLQLTGLLPPSAMTPTAVSVELMNSEGDLLLVALDPFFSESLTLAPDTYELLGSVFYQVDRGPSGFFTDLPFSSGFDLSADFKSIPEPSGISTVLFGLSAATVALAALRLKLTAAAKR
jgi:hypothetical protein